MKIAILVSLGFALARGALWGAAAEAGQPGGYMRAGVGGAAAAMGDAYTALAQGPQAVYWNPAALAWGGGPAISSTYNVLSLERQSNDAELVWEWPAAAAALSPTAGTFPSALSRGIGVWGLGWMGFSLGNDFEGRTADTPSYYTFGDHQDEYSLSHGRALLPWLAVGANFKLYDHVLEGFTAHGEGLDLGALFLLGPQLRLGMTASDLVSNFQWSTGTVEQFPVTLRADVAGTLWKDRLTLSSQVEAVQGQSLNYGLGLEVAVFRYFKVRGGVQENGLTFGGGATVPVGGMACTLDYAFMPDPLEQGNEQRISVDLVF